MQTLGHLQLNLALAPLQQAKEKISKMKRQPGMGHRGVLGRASPIQGRGRMVGTWDWRGDH